MKPPAKPTLEQELEQGKNSKLEREQRVCQERIQRAQSAIDTLLTGLEPEVHSVVDRLLQDPGPDSKRMLDAWRGCALRDVEAGRAVDVARTAKATLTAFGIACLVAYTRSYVDALDARRQSLAGLL